MGECLKGENLRKFKNPKRRILYFKLYLWLELIRRFKHILSELYVILIDIREISGATGYKANI